MVIDKLIKVAAQDKKTYRIPSTPIELVLIHWFSQSSASCQSIWTPDVWQHSESECKTSNVFTLAPDSVMFLYEADSISPARQIKSSCSGYVTSEPLSDTAGKDRQWLHHKLPPDVSVLPLVPYSIKDNYRAASDLMGIYYTLNPWNTLGAQINMVIKPMIMEIMVCSSFLPFTLMYHSVLLTTWTYFTEIPVMFLQLSSYIWEFVPFKKEIQG